MAEAKSDDSTNPPTTRLLSLIAAICGEKVRHLVEAKVRNLPKVSQ